MVDLKANTFKYGPPPDPGVPQPHFPGVSSVKFDPMEAQTVYRGMILKEIDARAKSVAQLENFSQAHSAHPGTVHKIGDFLPGLSSINSVYETVGWTTDATTNRKLPPETPKFMRRSLSDFRPADTASQTGSAWAASSRMRTPSLRGESLPQLDAISRQSNQTSIRTRGSCKSCQRKFVDDQSFQRLPEVAEAGSAEGLPQVGDPGSVRRQQRAAMKQRGAAELTAGPRAPGYMQLPPREVWVRLDELCRQRLK